MARGRRISGIERQARLKEEWWFPSLLHRKFYHEEPCRRSSEWHDWCEDILWLYSKGWTKILIRIQKNCSVLQSYTWMYSHYYKWITSSKHWLYSKYSKKWWHITTKCGWKVNVVKTSLIDHWNTYNWESIPNISLIHSDTAYSQHTSRITQVLILHAHTSHHTKFTEVHSLTHSRKSGQAFSNGAPTPKQPLMHHLAVNALGNLAL